MTVIIASASQLQTPTYLNTQQNSTRNLLESNVAAPRTPREALTTSGNTSGNTSADSAGASKDEITAAEYSQQQTYNKLVVFSAGINWDGLAKVEGAEQAAKDQASYNAALHHFGVVIGREDEMSKPDTSNLSYQTPLPSDHSRDTPNTSLIAGDPLFDQTPGVKGLPLLSLEKSNLTRDSQANAALQMLQSVSGRLSTVV